jgi:hypothetical protein
MNGLVPPYLLFAENMIYLERHTTNGRMDTSSKE